LNLLFIDPTPFERARELDSTQLLARRPSVTASRAGGQHARRRNRAEMNRSKMEYDFAM
jgi:hypothetical protein